MKIKTGYYKAENGNWVEIVCRYDKNHQFHRDIAAEESVFVGQNIQYEKGNLIGCGYDEEGKALFPPGKFVEGWDLVVSYKENYDKEAAILSEELNKYKFHVESGAAWAFKEPGEKLCFTEGEDFDEVFAGAKKKLIELIIKEKSLSLINPENE